MSVEEIFYILKDKDKITKKELYECGADDKYIKDAVDNELLTPIGNDEYVSGKTEELVYYGRYLIEIKNYKAANSVFNCAYVHDFDNFTVNYQLFYRALGQRKRGHIFKYFNVVYDKLIENNREYDANYYLYLIGNLYNLDNRYIDKFTNLELEDILLPGDDNFSVYENELRTKVFNNLYREVSSMVDERFDYGGRNNIPFEDMVEKELLLEVLVRERDFNRSIVSYLEKGYIEYVKKLLDMRDEKRCLTTSNEYVLKIVNSCLTIMNEGIIPKIKGEGYTTYDAIDANNYKLALDLEENYINSYNKEVKTPMYVALKQIVSLIESPKEVRVEETKVEEVKTTPVISKVKKLDDNIKQSIDDKVKKLHNGRLVFLLDVMDQETRDLVRDYMKERGYTDIFAFSIGPENERRIVLRYKPFIKEYVDLKATLDEAKEYYAAQEYQKAAECYGLTMMIGRPKDSTYGGYGMTLYHLGNTKEALDCLKIATILSKTEGKGKIDFSEVIERIEYPVARENRKPKVEVTEEEFVTEKESIIDDDILNDVIGLVSEGELSLVDACKKLNLSEEDTNIIKLMYARSCYCEDRNIEGDKYFKQVEKSKAKDTRVKKLYKDVLINKNYYRNRSESEKNKLLFIKK